MKKITTLTVSVILIISILLPGVSACTMQNQEVNILTSSDECIEVVKTIKDGDNWVNLYEANPEEKMRFRINVTYHDVDGPAIGYILKEIEITDKLPAGLEYLGNSTLVESFISPDGKNITWAPTESLNDTESVGVEFDVKVNEVGVFVNDVLVEAIESCYGEYRSNNGFAIIVSGCTDDVKYKDVDDDGNLERAYDLNCNSSDGYEVFVDPDQSSDDVKNIDGDEDSKIDHFIDINGDDLPDRYWDPDHDVLSEVQLIDVEYDGTKEWVYDSDGNGKPDKYYDPDDGQIYPYVVFELKIKVSGNGSVIKDPDGFIFLEGFKVKLSAEADSGSEFVNYSGDFESTELSVTITMDEEKTIDALFIDKNSGNGPTVEITKPMENFLYMFNIKLKALDDKTEIVGPINIKAKAESDKGIEKVEFYIDDDLKKTDTRAPYNYRWLFKPLGDEEEYTITVVAYDTEGNKNSDSIDVVRSKFTPVRDHKKLLLLAIVGGFLLKNIKDGDDDAKDYKKLLLLAIATVIGSGVILKNIGGGGEADDKIPVDPDDGDGDGGGKIKPSLLQTLVDHIMA